MKKIVYDAKTGEAIELEPVDARERIQAGLALAMALDKPKETIVIEEPVKAKK